QAMPQAPANRAPAPSAQRPPSLWDALGIGNVFGDEGAAGDAMMLPDDDEDEMEASGDVSGDEYADADDDDDNAGDDDSGDDAEGGD
ncbi:MAG: hypothetical protein AB7K09_22190, partial [Planctomycetota bacterium]